jgi:hypothetical protein
MQRPCMASRRGEGRFRRVFGVPLGFGVVHGASPGRQAPRYLFATPLERQLGRREFGQLWARDPMRGPDEAVRRGRRPRLTCTDVGGAEGLEPIPLPGVTSNSRLALRFVIADPPRGGFPRVAVSGQRSQGVLFSLLGRTSSTPDLGGPRGSPHRDRPRRPGALRRAPPAPYGCQGAVLARPCPHRCRRRPAELRRQPLLGREVDGARKLWDVFGPRPAGITAEESGRRVGGGPSRTRCRPLPHPAMGSSSLPCCIRSAWERSTSWPGRPPPSDAADYLLRVHEAANGGADVVAACERC